MLIMNFLHIHVTPTAPQNIHIHGTPTSPQNFTYTWNPQQQKKKFFQSQKLPWNVELLDLFFSTTSCFTKSIQKSQPKPVNSHSMAGFDSENLLHSTIFLHKCN